jgi:pantothenate kinase type III
LAKPRGYCLAQLFKFAVPLDNACCIKFKPGIIIPPKCCQIYTQKYALGVRNAYPKHNKLGVDRWLAMLAAYHYYNAPVCIVSCGSALTLDIVDSQGQHLGGMIMPGLNLMQQALSRGTANLNKFKLVS